MNSPYWQIVTAPNELREGLFGQIVLWVFEILPYLERRSIFPQWDIKSRLYGTPPNYTILPGVLDLAYKPPETPSKPVSLLTLRANHVSILGGDWQALHQLWRTYFRIPQRIEAEANRIDLPPNTLGVHYRGTDKNQSLWDTNPISQSDFLTLVTGFLQDRPQIDTLFIATDEFSFVAETRRQLPHLNLINLGEVKFHKANDGDPGNKGDRALLDCLMLSRCRYVLKCSSALSGFAKVLNPELEVYRVSSSKLFAGIPYFPDAYIPKLISNRADCQTILTKQFANDWLEYPYARWRFSKPFRSRRRYFSYKRLKQQIQRMKLRHLMKS